MSFSWADIQVESVLRYNGDQVPFHTRFLNKKHQEKGTYPLPAFDPKEPSGKAEWISIPGRHDEEFIVEEIRTERRGKPTKNYPAGRPLDDLYVLRSASWESSFEYRVGMVIQDMMPKFELMWNPSPTDPVRVSGEEVAAIMEERGGWADSVQESGW